MPFERMGFQAPPLASVTVPQGNQQGWWLRRCAHLDNCGVSGLPLPQARVRADYDVPQGGSCLSCRLSRRGPGRRYVSELGYAIREPKARGCMFMLPTMSRWPRKPQRRQVQLRPFGFCFQSHRGQWLLVPRSLPLKHTMPTLAHFSCKYFLSWPYSHCAMRWL